MIYELSPKDQTTDVWLFYDFIARKVKPRSVYQHLVCPSCGKLDELGAVALGLPSVDVVSKVDWFSTNDDWILVSERVVELCNSLKLSGVAFIPLPNATRHLLWIATGAPTDYANAGFEEKGPICTSCTRPRERLVGPFISGMKVPTESSVFRSEVWNESVKGRYSPLFASADVVKAMKAAKISGLEYNQPL